MDSLGGRRLFWAARTQAHSPLHPEDVKRGRAGPVPAGRRHRDAPAGPPEPSVNLNPAGAQKDGIATDPSLLAKVLLRNHAPCSIAHACFDQKDAAPKRLRARRKDLEFP